MNLKKIGLSEKKLLLLVICFAIGIIFFTLSEYSGFEKEKENDEFDEELYTAALESKLTAILEKMEGVGDVHVMITLSGGKNYRYASQTTKSLSESSSNVETFLQLQKDSGGNSAPILTEILYPEIRGVSVVCRGAADSERRYQIIKLIASALNLNENQIFVTE